MVCICWSHSDVEFSEISYEGIQEGFCLGDGEVWCENWLKKGGWPGKPPEIGVDASIGMGNEIVKVGTETSPETVDRYSCRGAETESRCSNWNIGVRFDDERGYDTEC